MFGLDDLLIGVLAAVVVDIIANIAKALAVNNKEEKVEDLGDRVIQAGEQGIKPENYDNYDEYMQAVNEFEIDPARSKEIALEEKQNKGVECLLNGIVSKTGIEKEMMSLVVKGLEKNSEFFKEIQDVFVKEIAANPKFLGDIGKFLGEDKIDFENYSKTVDTVAKMLKEVDPQIEDEVAKDRVRDLRE